MTNELEIIGAIVEEIQHIWPDHNAQEAIVLGSGLGNLITKMDDVRSIPFESLPGITTFELLGHDKQLVLGKVNGKSVFALAGRMHMYEGYTANEVVRLIRALGMLGIKKLWLTNAAGCINPQWDAGDINDHYGSY